MFLTLDELRDLTTQQQKAIACANSAEDIMQICDSIAMPVIESVGNSIYIYPAIQYAKAMKVENPYFYTMPEELYLRESRKINALFTRQCLGAPARIVRVFSVKRFEDMPKHRNTLAGGFEILLTVESGGIHVGDNPADCDVIHPIFGRTECKFKAGRIISQAKAKEEGGKK